MYSTDSLCYYLPKELNNILWIVVNKINFGTIVAYIVAENATSPETVVREMQQLIDAACLDHSPESQRYWDAVAPDGAPTAAEFLLRFTALVLRLQEDAGTPNHKIPPALSV